MTAKRTINVNVLAGQPTDGSGQVCIHLFVPDERGPFVEPHALHMASAVDGRPPVLVSRPTRGRLACDPKRTVAPRQSGAIVTVTPRTDDPRAVTCPRCKASADYLNKMKLLTAAEAGK